MEMEMGMMDWVVEEDSTTRVLSEMDMRVTD